MAAFHKYISGSKKYKYVFLVEMRNSLKVWVADLRYVSNKKHTQSYHKTEKEAAMAVDIKLIEMKKEPINILKRL